MAGSAIEGVLSRLQGAAGALGKKVGAATGRRWWVTPATAGIVVVVVVVVAAGAVAIPGVLSGTPPAPDVGLYNVTFDLGSEAGFSKSVVLAFDDSIDMPLEIEGTYLLGLAVEASYTDQSTSPLTDPSVVFVADAPEGTQGTWILAIPPNGLRAPIATTNTVPPNQTVEATSAEEALELTINGTLNETVGVGQWTGRLDCGSAAGGPLRPAGSITYSVVLTYFWIVPHAEVLP